MPFLIGNIKRAKKETKKLKHRNDIKKGFIPPAERNLSYFSFSFSFEEAYYSSTNPRSTRKQDWTNNEGTRQTFKKPLVSFPENEL